MNPPRETVHEKEIVPELPSHLLSGLIFAWECMSHFGKMVSHNKHIHGLPIIDLCRPKVNADQFHRLRCADALKWSTSTGLWCLSNNTAMTVFHMIINVSFHANPEESLPSQRQRSALPLVTSGIMNSIQYLRFERVGHDKEKKSSVHALIFSHLAQ